MVDVRCGLHILDIKHSTYYPHIRWFWWPSWSGQGPGGPQQPGQHQQHRERLLGGGGQVGGTAHARAQVMVSAQEAGGPQEVEQEEPCQQQESPAPPHTGCIVHYYCCCRYIHKCCCSIDNTIICVSCVCLVSCVHCKYDAATVTLQQICSGRTRL